MQANVGKGFSAVQAVWSEQGLHTGTQCAAVTEGRTPVAWAEAHKTLGGLLVMHGVAAGALGLPMVTTLLVADSMLGGDDDDPGTRRWHCRTCWRLPSARSPPR